MCFSRSLFNHQCCESVIPKIMAFNKIIEENKSVFQKKKYL
jgi:hypothetical protein